VCLFGRKFEDIFREWTGDTVFRSYLQSAMCQMSESDREPAKGGDSGSGEDFKAEGDSFFPPCQSFFWCSRRSRAYTILHTSTLKRGAVFIFIACFDLL